MEELTIDMLRNAAKSLDKEPPRHYDVVLPEEIIELYDDVRPWNSIHEHITNTKKSSAGKKRYGMKIHKASKL